MSSYSRPTFELPPDQLPKMSGYGYLDQTPIRQTQVQLPQVQSPDQIQQYFDSLPKPNLPDTVTARFGAGDKQMVASLLLAANGQDSGLVGVSPTYAAGLLTHFGYPTSADAWTAKQWSSAIGANALKPNPLSLLGY